MSVVKVYAPQLNLYSFFRCTNVGEMMSVSWNIFEIFQNGPVTKGVIKDFFLKLHDPPKSCI